MISRFGARATLRIFPVLCLLCGGPAAAVPQFRSTFQSYLMKPQGNAIAVGDLNGDGRPDLASTSTRDTVSVRLGL